MKLKVINVFADKLTGDVYQPGTVIEIEEEERAQNMFELGLVERTSTEATENIQDGEKMTKKETAVKKKTDKK